MGSPKLPRYVMFKGDNGNNLCLDNNEGQPYLSFNSTNRDLWGAHEVIPVPDQKDVVKIKSLYNQNFWRRSPNWIWADQSGDPGTSNLDCLFQVAQLSPTVVALQCLANTRYVKRLTAEGKTSSLNAAAPDDSSDVTAQMEVSEALSTRRVFDVKYLLDQLETTDMTTLILGSSTGHNNTSSYVDLAVTVTYDVKESSTWGNSISFSTGLSVTVTAGVPDVASASGTVSEEFTATTEMGTAIEKTVTFSSTYTVKDVKPDGKVTVRVSGTQATGTVPYTYNYQNTLVDGRVLPEDSGVDGIFKGVQVVNIVWEATDDSGAQKALSK